MTNYNDGKWHGHNGGECPVHPETVVEALWNNFGRYSDYEGVAGDLDWIETLCPIIAFRVIKEHKEPREFWIFDRFAFPTHDGALTMAHNKPGEIIHVREVTQ